MLSTASKIPSESTMTPSTLIASSEEVEYWTSYVPKCEECKIMLKQLRQMKQTIKTLIGINQEQYWNMVDYKEDSSRLSAELEEARWRIRLLERELAQAKTERGAANSWERNGAPDYELLPNDCGQGTYINRHHAKLQSPTLETARTSVTSPSPQESSLTGKIQELMNSATTSEQPLNLPFKFDRFGSPTIPDQHPGDIARVGQYHVLANIFAGTAAADDKPDMAESHLSPMKQMEKDLREAISEKDVKKLAETLLKIKEEKLQDAVDIALAQRKLEELLIENSVAK